MGFPGDRFNLEKQVTFYLSYHDNKINQYIHLVCIWPIFVSGLILLAHTQPLFEPPSFVAALPYGQFVRLNCSAIVAVIYMVWYVALDVRAGTLAAGLVLLSYLFANYVVVQGSDALGVQCVHVCIVIQAIAWMLQFVGHGLFERRKPALFASLDQALITAPMFVLLELLFPLGYRPELYRRVVHEAQRNVAHFKATKTL